MAVKRIARSPLTWVLALIVATGLGIGLAYFQPWKLFTNTTVNEAVPTVAASISPGAPAPQPQLLARGALISHEHGTSGTVAVLGFPDGSRVLRLENLDTSDGPDLHVWLSDAPVLSGRDGWGVFDDGAYVDLGKLRGNKGNQNYPIPAEVDLTRLTSVSIWCDRFNVSFGAAVLQQA
ncbi:DM13 domain-containing protein [Nocardia sp. NPDC059180]|uniref:DM13 domain-containing protein n=1 Tax=Nocardia sp. NPDC059180 TaxID=3346761 RepID=UPI0036859124